MLFPYYSIRFIFTGMGKLRRKFLKRLRFSITFKITSVYAVILTLILLTLNLVIMGGATAYLGMEASDIMYKDSGMIVSFLAGTRELPEENIKKLSALDNVNISIFDEKKNLMFTTQKDRSAVLFYDDSNSSNISTSKGNYRLVPVENKVYDNNNQYTRSSYWFKVAFGKTAEFNSQNIYIQITDDLAKEYLSLVILFVVLISITVVFIIIILILGSSASKKMLRPIDSMTKTVKNITINALDTRLDISGSQDELKDLAETFNSMLDRIQQAYELQNQFVSDASHELRTPISVIQGYTNLLDRWGKEDKEVLEESITAIKTEAENMKDLIEKLLFLARGDKNTQKVEKENFYINELIDEIVKETKLIDSSHVITSDINEAIMINADRKLIKEALRIFVDNSVKYTPDAGRITLNCLSQKTQTVITIEDTGAGISKEDLPNIFNRFYRADKSRTKETGGTGLGLAIAKWIVLKHKGTIEVQSKLNVGTKITVLLPIAG